MKKKMIAISASIICILCVVGGSLAFTSKTGTAKNVVASSDLEAELVVMKKEADGSLGVAADETSILPGEKISRIIRVKNSGSESAWIRIKIKGDDKLNLTGVDKDAWTFSDDYWYYNRELNKGEITEALCDGVELEGTVGNDYADKAVDFKVDAQATQKKHNGNTVFEAQGWPQD